MEPLPELSMTGDVYMMFAGGFITLLTLFVLFSTGSFMAVFVLWVLIVLVVVVLVYYRFIDIDAIIDSLFPPKAETPAAPTTLLSTAGSALRRSEVFYVSDNQFTYDEAPAVCAAYGGTLATLEQVIEAYNAGAEWCGYGWSAGGMALFPTQKSTWTELQREVDPGKRTACGRPGVNGGYFDPMSKFGVNCYGFKPQGTVELPQPVPGTDTEKFRRMVNQFKSMLASLNLSPFSRQAWSGNEVSVATYGSQFSKDVGKLGETRESYTNPNAADPLFVEQPGVSRIAAHVGLLGATGPQGIQGIPGEMGAPGTPGTPGARGEPGAIGPRGLQGLQGLEGPAGVSNVPGPEGRMGPTGPQGLQGQAGSAAAAGATGPPGPTGARGLAGTPGAAGLAGPPGAAGAAGVPGPAGVVPKNLSVDSIQLGNTIIDATRNTGQLQVRQVGSGRETGLVVNPTDWAELWLSRGDGWKKYD